MNLSVRLLRLFSVMLLACTGFAFAQKLQVVATIHPYYSLVSQIGGDRVEAIRLLPTGVSPHNYDPSPRDVIRVSEADLIIRNGGVGLDEWVLRLVNASGTEAHDLSIMDTIEFEPIGSSAAHSHEHGADHHHGEDHEADGHDHEGHYVNAHIWLDVTIAMSAAEAIGAALSQLDPANADYYDTNLDVLLTELAQLDQELLELLEPVRGENFVPFHDAWPYFARRYGLNLLIEIEPFPGREPSPDYLIYALNLIGDLDVKAIFGERQLSPRPAEAVADEAGLPLYILDPEGGGSEDAESYQELLRFNARLLLEALSD